MATTTGASTATPSTTATVKLWLEAAAIRGCSSDGTPASILRPSLLLRALSLSLISLRHCLSLSVITGDSSGGFWMRVGRARRRQRNETLRQHHSLCLDLSLSDGTGHGGDGFASGRPRHLSPSPLVFLFVCVEFRSARVLRVLFWRELLMVYGWGEMKKGSLRSKERSFEAFFPRVPRIGVEAGAYACFSLTQPRLDSP
ncbi:hypothetical protein PIB30_070518 [Stylosanthes scabra]|uniref:Uncharacterized protein n=1 Tax=Stylosanthes scabra TaxID=79078 RepID=A0ABU6ZMB0_9FABA|nr:hypothetical protein [Stylosanthes scabra]